MLDSVYKELDSKSYNLKLNSFNEEAKFKLGKTKFAPTRTQPKCSRYAGLSFDTKANMTRHCIIRYLTPYVQEQ